MTVDVKNIPGGKSFEVGRCRARTLKLWLHAATYHEVQVTGDVRMGILPQLLQLVKPLTALIGPAPLFYLYRSWQSSPPVISHCRRSLPQRSLVAISILLSIFFVYLTLLLFNKPENIFYLTKTRFTAPSSIIQTRLSTVRTVTADDTVLLDRLATSLSERLNYAIHGPNPLIHCTWCQVPLKDHQFTLGDGTMYLLFSVPQISAPYLFHAVILGLTTTPFLTRSQIARDLRVYLAYVLGLVLAAELWILVTFDVNVNSSANNLSEVTWLHWDLYSFRFSCLVLISALHAGLIYVFETGWVVLPGSMQDRLFQIGVVADTVNQRMKLARTVRATVMRDGKWRDRVLERWRNQKIEEPMEIPEEVREKWRIEGRNWVDGILKFEDGGRA